jgi:hypothetical protein
MKNKRHDLYSPKRKIKSSPFKAMPSVGCFGKYFRDEKHQYEHKEIDCTNEHGRSKR